jgi:hypothetical protein
MTLTLPIWVHKSAIVESMGSELDCLGSSFDLLFIGCVTLGKLFTLSVLCLPHLKDEDKNSTYLARCQWLMPAILATWEAEIGRIIVWANSSQDSISKISIAKWTGGVVQAVEHLLCELKALSSKPSPTQKNIVCFVDLKFSMHFYLRTILLSEGM